MFEKIEMVASTALEKRQDCRGIDLHGVLTLRLDVSNERADRNKRRYHDRLLDLRDPIKLSIPGRAKDFSPSED
jgi:hypothetical protein